MSRRVAAAMLAALTLAGCGGAASRKAAPHAVAVASAPASSPAVPAGCSQALLVTGAVRSGIADSTMTPDSAYKQLASAAKQIPEGNLRVDMDAVAFYLAQWNLAAVQGHGAGKWATRLAAGLAKISRECQS